MCKQKNNEPTDFTGLLQTNFSVKGLVIWGVGVQGDGSFMDHRQRRTTSSTTVEDIYTEGDPKRMGGREK